MKPMLTVMKFNLVILLVLLTINTGATAQNDDHTKNERLANSSARWQLPNRNLSPTPVLERLSYNPVRASRLNRSPEQGSDKKHRSDLQWNQMKALAPGARLVVKKRDDSWTRGRFVSVDGANLTLRHDGSYLDFTRPSILHIQFRGGRMKRKGAIRGFLAGAIVGAVWGGAACANDDFSGGAECAGLATGVGLYMGGLGAGVGAIVGSAFRKEILIYEAHSPELFNSRVSPARGVSRNPRTAPLSNQAGPGTPCLATARPRQSAPSICEPSPDRTDNGQFDESAK